MYKKIVLILVFAMILGANAIALSSKPKGDEDVLLMDSKHLEYNFGTVNSNTRLIKRIKIKNKLGQTIYVKDALSSCECVEAAITAGSVNNNEDFVLEINYNTSDLSGRIESTIYIQIDGSSYEFIHLDLILNVA